MSGQITQEVHWLVKVIDSVNLFTDEVVQSVCGVGEDQTISNPLGSLDVLGDFVDDFKRGFDSLVADGFARAESFIVGISVELKEVERVGARDRNQVSGAGPGDLEKVTDMSSMSAAKSNRHAMTTYVGRVNFDSPDQLA